MAPASRPYFICCRPRVGLTVCTFSILKLSGSEPYLSWVASSFEFCSSMSPPLITASPVMTDLICGAETTSLSSTMATAEFCPAGCPVCGFCCWPSLTASWVSACHLFWPLPVNFTATFQPPLFVSKLAVAPATSVPWTFALSAAEAAADGLAEPEALAEALADGLALADFDALGLVLGFVEPLALGLALAVPLGVGLALVALAAVTAAPQASGGSGVVTGWSGRSRPPAPGRSTLREDSRSGATHFFRSSPRSPPATPTTSRAV